MVGLLLAILVGIVFSGSPIFLSYYSRVFTWIIWIALILIIFKLSSPTRVWRAYLPMLPYLLWLGFYIVWAVIVAPTFNFGHVAKLVITTLVLSGSVAILTTRADYLRALANLAQFALLANLVVWFLIHWSSYAASVFMIVTKTSDPDMASFSRYGGMFANANHLGYICIVATILSVLATPWMAWVGRLSCLPLLYLAASRKAAVLYLFLIVLYLLIVQLRNVRFWLVSMTLVTCATMVFILSDGLRAKSSSVRENPAIDRIMDLQEKETAESGGMTRVALLHHWLSALRVAPWYGYGLQAMAGTVYDEDHPDIVIARGPYPVGAHNTFLGVWVEIGPIGLLAFLGMLLYCVKRCFKDSDPVSRWVLVSLAMSTVLFLTFSHNYLFCFEGKISFALFCLLPSSMGLQHLGRQQVRSA